MKQIYLFQVFKSNYSKLVFLSSLLLGYFLIPEHVFYGWSTLLGVIFIISFALVVTCLVRNMKERIALARNYTSSIVGTLAVAIGLAALQVCGVGAPICGAAIGLGLLSAIFPGIVLNFLTEFSTYIVVISIILQISSLYFMNCFKEVGNPVPHQPT